MLFYPLGYSEFVHSIETRKEKKMRVSESVESVESERSIKRKGRRDASVTTRKGPRPPQLPSAASRAYTGIPSSNDSDVHIHININIHIHNINIKQPPTQQILPRNAGQCDSRRFVFFRSVSSQ
jgi:hypothetical protein